MTNEHLSMRVFRARSVQVGMRADARTPRSPFNERHARRPRPTHLREVDLSSLGVPEVALRRSFEESPRDLIAVGPGRRLRDAL